MRVGPAPPFLLPFGQQYLHNRVQQVHIDDVARLIAHIVPLGRGSRAVMSDCVRNPTCRRIAVTVMRFPEPKRPWEREHRKQRNARRRALRFAETTAPQNPLPDPTPSHQAMSGWKDILGLAVGVGIIILGALSGAVGSVGLGPSAESGSSST